MDLIVATILLIVLFLIGFIIFILKQMKNFKRSYTLTNKTVDLMSKEDIVKALGADELNSPRWIEDIFNILLQKQVVDFDELPMPVQEKIKYKQALRERLKSLAEGGIK